MQELNGRQKKSRLARNVPENFHPFLAEEIGHIPSVRGVWESPNIDEALHWANTRRGHEFWKTCYDQWEKINGIDL